jgi:hypothetical protein
MRTGSPARVGTGTCLAVVLLAGCHISSDLFKARFSRTEELTAPLVGVTVLKVTTNVGRIRLDAADAPEARITAEIKVKAASEPLARDLAERVEIVAEPRGQTLVVRVVKPADLRRNELSVDFTITAPAHLAVACVTNVGDIRVAGFSEHVQARTDVGAITCTGVRGDTDLHTNVGDIKVDYVSDAPAALNASATTNVGSIDFAGPEQISANLTAGTNVGSIETDRPLTVIGSLQRSVRASLGSAEGQVNLTTNVGSIRIR